MLDFEEHIDEFRGKDIQIIAVSVDTLEKASQTVERHGLSFTIGYGLDAREVSSKTGTFYDGKDRYLHATGYIINPDGKVANGVYSTMAIGRLVPKDCLGLIDNLRKN